MRSSEGALRATLSALQSNGAFSVVLRLPGMATSGNDGEQLGLMSPQFQDVPLWPAAWRKAGSSSELLVYAGALQALVGTQTQTSVESLLQSAVGMVVQGVLYVITGVEALLIEGVACAYRLKMTAPTWA